MAFFLAGLILRTDEKGSPLAQGFSFIRMPVEPFAGVEHLTDNAANAAAALSVDRRVVYVDAEFFGGEGTQSAVGWERGQIAFGPRLTATPGEDAEGYEVVPPEGDMAINEALRWLGVQASPGQDEFDTLGLYHLDKRR